MNDARNALLAAIEHAADDIEHGAPFEWGHVGRCTVGHIAQRLAAMSDREIVAAFEQTLDQWREHAAEYFDVAIGDEPLATTESPHQKCPQVGASMRRIYRLFHLAGLDAEDIGHLEFLSDPTVLAHIPPSRRARLRRNDARDVVLYLRTMAHLLRTESEAATS